MPESMAAPIAEILNSGRTIKEKARLVVVEFLVQAGEIGVHTLHPWRSVHMRSTHAVCHHTEKFLSRIRVSYSATTKDPISLQSLRTVLLASAKPACFLFISFLKARTSLRILFTLLQDIFIFIFDFSFAFSFSSTSQPLTNLFVHIDRNVFWSR
jgi:hypothetical protein